MPTSPNRLARWAGLLYLFMTAAAFNEGYVLPRTVVAGDATATAEHIRASSTLFRLGFLGDVVADTCWLLTAMALYVRLRHVDRPAAAAMVIFAAVGAAIQGLNQLDQCTALSVATTDDRDIVTLMFATMQRHGYVIDEVFFGLWLVPVGYLVIRSGYFPRQWGWLLMVACAGSLIDLFTQVLAPSRSNLVATVITYPAGVLGELTFRLWLPVRGIWASRASADLPHWTLPTPSTPAS
jgi:hypothetical protein